MSAENALVTREGMPVVDEETFLEVVTTYPIASGNGSPEVRARIKIENPQIFRILKLGFENAPTAEAKDYFQTGIELAYELLRTQASKSRE